MAPRRHRITWGPREIPRAMRAFTPIGAPTQVCALAERVRRAFAAAEDGGSRRRTRLTGPYTCVKRPQEGDQLASIPRRASRREAVSFGKSCNAKRYRHEPARGRTR